MVSKLIYVAASDTPASTNTQHECRSEKVKFRLGQSSLADNYASRESLNRQNVSNLVLVVAKLSFVRRFSIVRRRT